MSAPPAVLSYRTIEIEIGSEEWRALRNNGLGSSDASTILNCNPYGQTWNKLHGQKTGRLPEPYVHPGMVRGTELEPVARAMYELQTGKNWPPAFMWSLSWPWAFGSWDGLNGDEDWECKCYVRGSEFEDMILRGEVPAHDFAQAQWRFGIRPEARVCHYTLFLPKYGLLPAQLVEIEITPDPEFIRRLFIEADHFWRYIETGEEPELTEKDEQYIFDAEAVKLAEAYKDWSTAEKAAKREKDALRERIQSIVESTHPRLRFGSTGVLATFLSPEKAQIDRTAVIREWLASGASVLRFTKPVKPTLRIYIPGDEEEAA